MRGNLRKGLRLATAGMLTATFLACDCLAIFGAGMPSTKGHDKYVNGDVFSVIGSDTFGTKELDEPLFDKSKGSHDISNLVVPTLAYDDTSIAIVWEKPEKYDDISDYHVYINGKLQESVRENFKKNADWTYTYMKSFYDYYNKNGSSDMVNVDIHSFRATNLEPETSYTFKVVAVDNKGNEVGNPKTITKETSKSPVTVDITDPNYNYGVVYTEGYTEYNDEINAIIEKNTKEIQRAIDELPKDAKLVIPEGEDGKVLVSGALWLHSNMTLELDGTLWASPNSDHFEIGFLMYPFYTDTRDWGLINAVSADENAPLENIRITGSGTLYGNGWKYGAGNTVYGDGYSSNAGENTQSGDPDVKNSQKEYGLPRYVSGNNAAVYDFGVQAADSAKKYLANLYNEDGTRKYSDELINSLGSKTRSKKWSKDSLKGVISDQDLKDAYATRASLLILRNITNVYVSDITVENPSNHSVNILESRNIATNNVKVFSYDGNNGDGLGFGCSQNVICWNNFTDTGDDNIGYGSSVGEGARDCNIQTNSELWMFNNFLREGHGGLACGSHTANGVQDVLFEDTVMNHIDMAFRFKSAPTNGGFGANITMRDCAIADTDQAWVITTKYNDANSASSTEAAEIGEFYNFASYNISVEGTKYNNICVYADVDYDNEPEKPAHSHHNLYFQDITFSNVGKNGKYKNYGGWDTLTACNNSVFYNVTTKSYNSKAKNNHTDKAWTNIKYCNNIIFQGTSLDSLNANKDLMNQAMTKPVIKDSTVNVSLKNNGRGADVSWNEAKANNYSLSYGYELYKDDKMIDFKSGIKDCNTEITGLSAGVNYKLKIFASTETGNKTLVGEKEFKTGDLLDSEEINLASNKTVKASNPIYTCAQLKFDSSKLTDERVRGYNFYVNGVLTKTLYNYEIAKYKTEANVSHQIGRLTPGKNNEIVVKAFTDAGLEAAYDTVYVKTLDNYDYKAPVFNNKDISVVVNDDNSVNLSWNAAVDDTMVNGYRLYIDGKPVYTDESKGDFNPVNESYTTKETSIKLTNIDTSKAHKLTIQAGDSWWKAKTKMGSFDKMACYNWTVEGISTDIPAYTKKDESKEDESKEDESKQDESKQDESKQDESKQDESKKDETTIDSDGEIAADENTVNETSNNTKTYKMLSGSSIVANANEKLILRSEANFADFVELRLDGKVVDPYNYTVYAGSTVVELKPEYLESLDEGEHIFEIVSKDGIATANVKLLKPANNNSEVAADQAKTADSKAIYLYTIVIVIMSIAIFAIAKKTVKDIK